MVSLASKPTAMPKTFLLFIFCLSMTTLSAQTMVVPGYTGYAVPAEKEGNALFAEKVGLQNWNDTRQEIHYYILIRKTGKLLIALNARNGKAGSKVKLSVAGKEFKVSIPATKDFTTVKAGEVYIADTGYYQITLSAIEKAGNNIADIQSLQLRGEASVNCHFNTKERRNAASVHLRYPLADSVKAIAFYNELTIPEGADQLYSYYMACGFARGYFGIQVNSPTERRVIFSVWDAGNEAVNRDKVADSNKVQLLAKGDGVFADGFGNEGTGGHSHWVYPWKTGQTYQFLVTALADSASQKTIYTGYFFLPELGKWKLIASFKAPKDGHSLSKLYSFNENFIGSNGQLQRKAFFGNQWIQRNNGRWMELTRASFSYDATGKAGDRLDYGGGVTEGRFYLWNGGFEKGNAYYGERYERPASDQPPLTDVTRNADSVSRAIADRTLILEAVALKQIDTTGSKEGVYYQIVQEGKGDYVSIEDTVTVFYKGSLLKDGNIFDQTKEKPAIFPLKRLIKGWQIGVPFCKTGGKIRLFIPSGQGYSIRSRSMGIPPNSVLVFDIEVVSTKKPTP